MFEPNVIRKDLSLTSVPNTHNNVDGAGQYEGKDNAPMPYGRFRKEKKKEEQKKEKPKSDSKIDLIA